MKKKVLSLLVVVVVVFVIFISVLPSTHAARCSAGGMTCEGECCTAWPDRCEAGPCGGGNGGAEPE